MSQESTTTTSGASERRLVLNRIGHLALPGALTATLLLVMSLLGVPGAAAAAYDLWTHAWKVHPLLWSAAGLVTVVAILQQSGDVAEDLDKGVTLPLLHFFAHVLSFSTAAVALFGWAQKKPWAIGACGQWGGLVVLFIAYLALAAIAVCGVFIVERREAARRPGGAAAPKATKIQLRIFMGLALFFLVLVVLACLEPGDTEEVVKKWLLVPLSMLGPACR